MKKIIRRPWVLGLALTLVLAAGCGGGGGSSSGGTDNDSGTNDTDLIVQRVLPTNGQEVENDLVDVGGPGRVWLVAQFDVEGEVSPALHQPRRGIEFCRGPGGVPIAQV